ncbi:MAG: hypothetical protein HGA87_01585 [Desulfobulbaceae bacterium]|nr:hypothetical protein [Desulfobulbaceae bacterium]
MAKRFTETSKWVDPWFRQLTPKSKLLFLYILDSCNNAGFLEVDAEMILFQTGMSSDDFLGAKQELNRGIIEVDGWFWVKNFLRHQKNDTLNPTNNAHKQIIALLMDQSERFDEISEFVEILERENLAPKQPLNRGTGKGNGKGNGNGTTEEELLFTEYPKKVNKKPAIKSITSALKKVEFDVLLSHVKRYAQSVSGKDKKFIPDPATWFNQERWTNFTEGNVSGVDYVEGYEV